MAAPQDHCWLCNKCGAKTKEHIPPESAFNDAPLLLMKVDERSMELGAMDWTLNQRFDRGLFVRSGYRYGGA